jgi:hypothetical protein
MEPASQHPAKPNNKSPQTWVLGRKIRIKLRTNQGIVESKLMVGYKRTNGACTNTGIETKNAEALNISHCLMLFFLPEERGFSNRETVVVDAIADDTKFKLNN